MRAWLNGLEAVLGAIIRYLGILEHCPTLRPFYAGRASSTRIRNHVALTFVHPGPEIHSMRTWIARSLGINLLTVLTNQL